MLMSVVSVYIQIFTKSVENAKICNVDKIFLALLKYLKILYKVPHMHNFFLLAFEVQILTKIRQNYEYLQIIFPRSTSPPNVQQNGTHLPTFFLTLDIKIIQFTISDNFVLDMGNMDCLLRSILWLMCSFKSCHISIVTLRTQLIEKSKIRPLKISQSQIPSIAPPVSYNLPYIVQCTLSHSISSTINIYYSIVFSRVTALAIDCAFRKWDIS
ncbi:hypothetical protein AGLY_015116 [Aphis glycines]|uniref:Uncharacterized protein n=1 Tax=Aphis glycines TaxID=307491 RepID=A0A6G0T1H4_APHGL|nr:hypothetical protein AGLY_015116 [Aphis glycines]